MSVSPAHSPCSGGIVPSATLWVGTAERAVTHFPGCTGTPRRISPCGRRSASRTWGAAAAFRTGACNQPGQSHFLQFAMNIYAICAEAAGAELLSQRGDGSLAPQAPLPSPVGPPQGWSRSAAPRHTPQHCSWQAARPGTKVLEAATLGIDIREDRVSKVGLGAAVLGLHWGHLHQLFLAPKAGPGCWVRGTPAVRQLEGACPLPARLGQPSNPRTAWAGANRDGAQQASSGRTWLPLSRLSLFGGKQNYSRTHRCGLVPAREGVRDMTAVGCRPLPGGLQDPRGSFAGVGQPALPLQAGAGRMLAPLAQGLTHSGQ